MAAAFAEQLPPEEIEPTMIGGTAVRGAYSVDQLELLWTDDRFVSIECLDPLIFGNRFPLLRFAIYGFCF